MDVTARVATLRVAVLAAVVAACAPTVIPVTPAPAAASPEPSLAPTPPAASPQPPPSRSAPVKPTTVLMPGTFRSVPFPAPSGLPIVGQVMSDQAEAVAVFADGHGTVGYALLDLATGKTRTLAPLALNDLGPGPAALAGGRLALLASSRTNAGETYRYEIEDLGTGARTTLDTADAPGHFHGEGAPVQPDPAILLSPGHVAYIHLFVEGPDLVGELRVGPIEGPMRTVITSKLPVRPVALSETVLAYTVPGDGGDELHAYDLGTGRDRLVARGAIGFEVALGRGRMLYTIRSVDVPGRAIIRDLADGSEAVVATGRCGSLSLNDRYATVDCREPTPDAHETTITVYDLATLRPIEVARSSERIGNARLSPGSITWNHYDAAPPAELRIETLEY